MTAFGCIYSNYPFNTEKNICTHTSLPTNQPVSPPTHPSPLLPISISLSYIFLPSFLLSFPFFLNQSIHSFIVFLSPPPTLFLSTTYPSTFLPHTHPSLLTTAISSPWPFHFSFFTFTFRPYNNSLHTPIIKHHMTVFFITKFVELLHFTSLHHTSPQFTSLLFTTLHLTSLHFTSPHHTSLQLTPTQFNFHFNFLDCELVSKNEKDSSSRKHFGLCDFFFWPGGRDGRWKIWVFSEGGGCFM